VANGTDSDQQTRWASPPLGGRLIGAGFAVIGVILLVVGLLTVRGHSPDKPGAAPPGSSGPASSAPPSSGPASSGPSSTGPSSPPPTTVTLSTTVPPPSSAPRTSAPASTAPSRTAPAPPPAPPRAPLTVLNNSTIHNLGEQVAASIRTKGWQIAQTGNFAGRIPVTTVYYDPGNAAELRAARQLAKEFPQVERVFPRYAGLPPTPPGIVLVVTRDWVG
jgi:LytR cell envelope-related transcriptional attenuator